MGNELKTTAWTVIEEEAAARIHEVTPCTRSMSLYAARAAISAERDRCAKIAHNPDHSRLAENPWETAAWIAEEIENG